MIFFKEHPFDLTNDEFFHRGVITRFTAAKAEKTNAAINAQQENSGNAFQLSLVTF